MLEVHYKKLDQEIFTILHAPEPITEVDDIAAYSQAEGLALKRRRNRIPGRSLPCSLDVNLPTAKCLGSHK